MGDDSTSLLWSTRLDTVYLGGGTPSALEPGALEAILQALRRALPLTENPRITLEANPEDVTSASVAAWRDLGIGTVSLGVQSFEAGELRFLGRQHGPEQAAAAVETALGVGFETVSLDLIFGLPGQSLAAWRASLERTIALGPDHVSCYELTVHEGTPFGRARDRGALVEAPEDDRADLFLATHRWLAEAGYEAYEVSNFARSPEHRSRHNSRYWTHAPYLGLGPSAHSFDGGATRWWNRRRLADWQREVESGRRPVAGSERLGAADLVLEALSLGLRTTAGVDLEALRARHGIDLTAANAGLIDDLRKRGLLRHTTPAETLRPTLRGLAVADSLARSFELGEAGTRR